MNRLLLVLLFSLIKGRGGGGDQFSLSLFFFSLLSFQCHEHSRNIYLSHLCVSINTVGMYGVYIYIYIERGSSMNSIRIIKSNSY